MRKTMTMLGITALLAGCGDGNSADTPAEAASDVAMVERMSQAPFRPILPGGITAMDIERYGLDKPGCSFRRGAATDPLFIAGKDEAFMRVGTELKRLAAKSTSADLPGGARTTYVGLTSWIDLVRLPDEGSGADALNWPGRLIVHDSQERVAYRADGTVTCHE
jgi:hypothetical protein